MRLFAASRARCNEVTVGAEGSTGAVRYLSLICFTIAQAQLLARPSKGTRMTYVVFGFLH